MTEFLKLLKNLCDIDAPSGNEDALKDFIKKELTCFCELSEDALGNLIAFKKGEKTPKNKVMLDAHLDEVGIIITDINEKGFLLFETVGGISAEALISSAVRFQNAIGIIGTKPIHLAEKSEREAMPKQSSLYIDIGAKSKQDALNYVKIGEIGAFYQSYWELSDNYISHKALDDRIGVAALITLIKNYNEYDFYATFTLGEEIGLRGAKTVTGSVKPDYAIVVETTTAGDLENVPDEKAVCHLGKGAVIPFMDRATLYNRKLYDLCFEIANKNGISVQTKNVIAGGNNAGAISLSQGGIPTITVSAPCRYLHSASTLAHKKDLEEILKLLPILTSALAEK